MPARILLQDLTGVPAIVDLAAMREGIRRLGGDPGRINPLQPVDLVIDHSVQVDHFGSLQSFAANSKLEYERNQRTVCVPALGAEGLRQLQRGAARHRHRPSDQPGVPRQGGLHQAVERRHPGLSRHAGGRRFPHAHDQRAGGGGLGRGRHRGRGGHAGPAADHADPRSDRLQAPRPASRGGHRHRPGADHRADAAQEGRGGEVRGVLRSGTVEPGAGGPGHHRQHGAGVRRHRGLLPGGQRDPGVPDAVEPEPRAHQPGGGLQQGAGVVPHRRNAGPCVLRHPGARPERGGAQPGRAPPAPGPGAAARRQAVLRRGPAQHEGAATPPAGCRFSRTATPSSSPTGRW